MFTNKKMLSRIEGCFKFAWWYWVQGSDPQHLTSRLFIIDQMLPNLWQAQRWIYMCSRHSCKLMYFCIPVSHRIFLLQHKGIKDRRFRANFKSIQKSACLGRGDGQSHALHTEGWASVAADFSISHWSMAELFIFWFPTCIFREYTFANSATNRIRLF